MTIPSAGDPLSVGIFTYSTRPRGSVVCAASLAEALHRRGHDVVLHAIDKGEGEFFRKLRCPLELIPGAPAAGDVEQLIKQRSSEVAAHVQRSQRCFDIMHAQDCLVARGLGAAQGFSTARGFSTAQAPRQSPWLVRTVHHLERFQSPFLQDCQQRSIENADAVVTVSRAVREELHKRLGIAAELIENGNDTERFVRPGGSSASAMRQRFGLGSRDYVLSVGGIEPRKNPMVELEAFRRLHHRHPELCWVIAGGCSLWDHSALREAFHRTVQQSEVQSAVIVLGEVNEDELTALYRHARVLLHAACQEGFGLSVVEAATAGVPVVVSDGPPFDEYLGGNAVRFVDPSCSRSVADGLETALHCSKEDRARLRSRVARFDWNRSAALHERLYRSLLASSGRDSSLPGPKPWPTSPSPTKGNQLDA